MSSNREIEQRTRACLVQASQQGAIILTQRGSSDVALARNIALMGACNKLRELGSARDTVLMVDDDMVWTPGAAQKLVSRSREGVAVSAIYSTYRADDETVSIAAQLIPNTRPKETWIRGSWVTGLGFIAIPAELLLELEQNSETWLFREERRPAFTWAGPKYDRWWSEDYCLCERLGGVELNDVRVGHIKRVPLWPTDELVFDLREQALAGLAVKS